MGLFGAKMGLFTHKMGPNGTQLGAPEALFWVFYGSRPFRDTLKVSWSKKKSVIFAICRPPGPGPRPRPGRALDPAGDPKVVQRRSIGPPNHARSIRRPQKPT